MSRRWLWMLAALPGLSVPGAPGRAQQPAPDALTVVGTFYQYDGHAALFVVTNKPSKDDPDKYAGVGVQFENAGADYRYNGTYTKLFAVFPSAADWRKFVAIWKKAQTITSEWDDGNYFDGQTELGVGKTKRGEITFTLAGGGADDKNLPKQMTVFFLAPKDVAAFNRDVAQVSAYFAK